LVLFFLFSTKFLFSDHKSNKQLKLNLEAIESFLKTAEVVSATEDYKGRTGAWTVELVDGEAKHRGFFKHVNRPRPENLPDSYKYEIAAYELSKLLGLYVIPPVVEREIQNIQGSLQLYMEGCQPLISLRRRNILPPDPQRFRNILDETLVFEILTNDQCRDEKDILVQTDTWDLCRIDFSEAFSPEEKLNPDCQITRCSRSLYKKLSELGSEEIDAKLTLFLNEKEITALKRRRELILEHIKNLIKKQGEQAVLYD
jgi:hypothetical protein